MKLNHTPGPLALYEGEWNEKLYLVIGKANLEKTKFEKVCCVVTELEKVTDEDVSNAKLYAAAPDMLEALIDLVVDGMNHYHLYPNSHRKTAREYYSVEIKIIESATGKTWEELSK